MKKLLLLCATLCTVLSAQAVEILYGPYVQALTQDAAYVVWVTDKASYGWVELKGEGDKKSVTYTIRVYNLLAGGGKERYYCKVGVVG